MRSDLGLWNQERSAHQESSTSCGSGPCPHERRARLFAHGVERQAHCECIEASDQQGSTQPDHTVEHRASLVPDFDSRHALAAFGDAKLYGEYTSYSGMRTAGLGVLVGSLVVGSYFMYRGLLREEEICSGGYCHDTTSVDGTSLGIGIGVTLVGGTLGWVLAAKSDEATIVVSPMAAARNQDSPRSVGLRQALPSGAQVTGTF